MIHAGNETGRKRRGCDLVVGCLAVLIVLSGSGVCAGQVLNPSFETVVRSSQYGDVPLSWPPTSSPLTKEIHPSFGYKSAIDWKTEGGRSAGAYSRLSNNIKTHVFAPGDYVSLRQDMDLTGMSAMVLDVRLVAYPSGPFEHFKASLLVEGVPLWSETVGGVYLDQQVNVSKFAGPEKTVELRITAVDGGSFTSAYWAQWDNIRLIEGTSAIEAIVDLDPDTLNLASNGKWITGYIELPEGFEAAQIDGATVTLEDIPAHMGQEGWATPEANEGNISDLNENGVLERMVKFERAAVQAIVQPHEATVAIRGRLVDGTPFEGLATIQVIDKGGKKK